MRKAMFFTGVFVLLFVGALLAQPETINEPAVVGQPPVSGVNSPPMSSDIVPTKTEQEVWLSIGVLIFGVVVILAQAILMLKREETLGESFKYLSVTLIIVGALFLVTAGYGNTQIAPIIGLLGTVAGYLLGRSQMGEGTKK